MSIRFHDPLEFLVFRFEDLANHKSLQDKFA